jgi:SpoVK/Ycf46/Vps4 family AAA+-type ATPase
MSPAAMNGFETGNGSRFRRMQGELHPALPPGVYTYGESPYGMLFDKVKTNDAAIQEVDEKQAAVMREISCFWAAGEWYKSKGFPHKRGVLLYGPPGTGKTTLIREVAASAVFNGGIVLRLCDLDELPTAIHLIREVQPDARITVVIEDIEKWIRCNQEEELLDLLDGMQAVNNTLFIATTNHMSALPKRLTNRPSRFDTVISIGYPDTAARRKYITSVLPEASAAKIENLVQKTNGMSMAHIKEAIIRSEVTHTLDQDVLALWAAQCAQAEKEANAGVMSVPQRPSITDVAGMLAAGYELKPNVAKGA